ncbi:MAG TPA: hypothetical protein VJS92_04250 [Candidatus Polarisedimenticolaceae bacterium]|nr:hypothetical protein [Candidatus Polarisedimenticolaceae bacterium]
MSLELAPRSLVARALVAAAALGTLPAWAADPLPEPVWQRLALISGDVAPGGERLSAPQLTVGLRPSLHRPQGFYRTHLLPRLNDQLRQTSPVNLAPERRELLEDEILLPMLTDEAHRRAQRATVRAVRNFLLEETSLSNVVSGLRARGTANVAGPPGRRMAFDVGFSHGMPKLQMRAPLASGRLSMSVGLRGTFSMDFRTSALAETRVMASYSRPDDSYSLTWRIGF